MQGHPLGFIHGVDDLNATVRFLAEHLSLPVVTQTEEAAVLDNGSVSIRLVRGLNTPRPVALDVTTRDLEVTASALGKVEGCRSRPAEWLTPTRKVIVVSTPFGIDLYVGRDFDEDELGIKGDIPTELEWEADALETIQTLATHVPVAFRQKVREKTARRAEALTVEAGFLEVTRHFAVAALIEVTPYFQLERLRSQLEANGLNPSQFAPHFER